METALTGTAILAFIAFSIPIIGSLWRIFSVREKLTIEIGKNSHRLDLLEQHSNHLYDQQILALNGIKEIAQHARDRSAKQEEILGSRLLDVERFLEKSTTFSPRSKS